MIHTKKGTKRCKGKNLLLTKSPALQSLKATNVVSYISSQRQLFTAHIIKFT